jgi:hypothetical protein
LLAFPFFARLAPPPPAPPPPSASLHDTDAAALTAPSSDPAELAGKPDRFAYLLTLQEHIEPAEPPDASLLDADILEEAGDLVDDLVEGLDLGLDLPTGLERFVSPLTDLLGRLQQLRSDLEGSGGSP